MEDQMQQEQQPEETEQAQPDADELEAINLLTNNGYTVKKPQHNQTNATKTEQQKQRLTRLKEVLEIINTPPEERTPEQIQKREDGLKKAREKVQLLADSYKSTVLFDQLEIFEKEKLEELRKMSIQEIEKLPEDEQALYWGTLQTKAALFYDAITTLTQIMPDAKENPEEAGEAVRTIVESIVENIEKISKISQSMELKSFATQDGKITVKRETGTQLAAFWGLLLGGISDFAKIQDDAKNILNFRTLPQIDTSRANSLDYPLDKVNSTVWGLMEKDTKGQIAIKAEKTNSKTPLNIFYSIDFDELGNDVKISKRLTPFDKRVYIAVSALYNAGESHIITLTQIYYAMGYTGRPGSNDIERISKSVMKMQRANIYISNEQEAATYKYDKFVYTGSLLPFEQMSAIANGKIVDSAMHLFREPPVMSFAKQRKQITTIKIELLQSPISKTDANLQIDDYLIERISRAKNGKQPRKILYSTIYEKAQIKGAKQQQRAKDKIKRYLNHYQKCGMITRYTEEKDGITVYFESNKE